MKLKSTQRRSKVTLCTCTSGMTYLCQQEQRCLPQQVAQDGSSCIIKHPLHTRVITSFRIKTTITSSHQDLMSNTSLRREHVSKNSSKQLTTKILQVQTRPSPWRWRFLYKVQATNTKGNSATRSKDIINKGNSATRSKQLCSTMEILLEGPTNTVQQWKQLLQFATNSVLLQLYSIHIFTSQEQIRQGILVFRGSVVAAAHHFCRR